MSDLSVTMTEDVIYETETVAYEMATDNSNQTSKKRRSEETGPTTYSNAYEPTFPAASPHTPHNPPIPQTIVTPAYPQTPPEEKDKPVTAKKEEEKLTDSFGKMYLGQPNHQSNQCKLCQVGNGNLNCSVCEKNVCISCIFPTKRFDKKECVQCKGFAIKEKNKERCEKEARTVINIITDELSNPIDQLSDLITTDVSVLSAANMFKILEVCKSLEREADQLNRKKVIAGLYFGYKYFATIKQNYFDGKEENRHCDKPIYECILNHSYKYVDKDWTIDGVKIKDLQQSFASVFQPNAFLTTALKIYIFYCIFPQPETQIRVSSKVYTFGWFSNTSKENLLDMRRRVIGGH